MAATKTQPAKATKKQATKAQKQKPKPTTPAKAKTSRVSKGHSGLKLFLCKDRISTNPMTASPQQVCLCGDQDCEKHVQEWMPRTPELVAQVETWLEKVDEEGWAVDEQWAQEKEEGRML